jgi:fructosamine-3-kinase
MQACDWPAFYATRRLIPGLKMALDSGNLPVDTALRLQKLIERLPDLCGPEVTPTLLHGDAQKNNFISSAIGAFVIDPAVYYGHPEMDLAFVDYFETVPQEVFNAYREELPIDPGFERRRSLWRIWGYLAAVTVEGGGYLPHLEAALKEYV